MEIHRDIDDLRARQGSALADLYLHGKLLYAWVLRSGPGDGTVTIGVAWTARAAPPLAGMEAAAPGTGDRDQRRAGLASGSLARVPGGT